MSSLAGRYREFIGNNCNLQYLGVSTELFSNPERSMLLEHYQHIEDWFNENSYFLSLTPEDLSHLKRIKEHEFKGKFGPNGDFVIAPIKVLTDIVIRLEQAKVTHSFLLIASQLLNSYEHIISCINTFNADFDIRVAKANQDTTDVSQEAEDLQTARALVEKYGYVIAKVL